MPISGYSMDSKPSSITNGSVANGSPRSEDRAYLAVGFAVGGIFVSLLYAFGFSRGAVLLPALFVGLYVAVAVGGAYGHRRRRPRWVEFSDHDVKLSYSNGSSRSIPWHTIASVDLGHFLRDVYVNIRYMDGRVEDKAHVYGEAALELKRRFEEWQPSSTS